MRILFFILTYLMAISIHAQKGEGTIYFKDSKELKGIVKIKTGGVIKFKANKKSKKEVFYFKSIERIKIYNGSEINSYVYLKIKGKPIFRVLEEITSGKVNLYRIVTEGYSAGVPMGGGFGGGMGMTMGHSYSIKDYYVRKQNEKEPTHLGSTNLFSKNFKKAASNYFGDCASLVKKIQNKEFKKKQIRMIVEYYNENCE